MSDVTDARIVKVPQDVEFGDSDCILSYELDALVQELIEKHQNNLGHLIPYTVSAAWKRKGGKSHGVNKMSGCTIPSGVLTAFTDAHFIVTVSADHIRNEGINGRNLEAIVFRALCQAGVDEKGNPTIWPPDFVGYNAEIQYYGAWEKNLQVARNVFMQAKLPL